LLNGAQPSSPDPLPGLDDAIRISPAYELVVERIRLALHLGRYLPGEKLPAERTLAKQLGVSRVTLREALRVLQGENYLQMSRGASGGAVVLARHEPIEVMRQRLRERIPDFDDILDFRIANEGAAARLAAERRTDDDIERAAQTIDEMRECTDISSFRRVDSTFHLLIAAATWNHLLRTAIQESRAAMFIPLDAIDLDVTRESSCREHKKILKAIIRRDPRAAERAMTAHIETTRADIHRLAGD
jgi:DNA-binding FadR family transcriptional regulator